MKRLKHMKKSELRQTIKEEIRRQLNEDAKEDLEKSYEKDVESFREDLSKYMDDSKVKAILDAGLADGNPNDDKLPFTSTKIAVKDLIPTQKEIGFDQSIKGNLDDEFGSLNGILKGNVNVGGPIVTYAGKYIIDGHHRWSTVFAANPGANMDALDIAPKAGFQPLDILKAVHSAVAIDRKRVPSSDPKGENILVGINYSEVLNKVKKYLTPEAENVWKSNGIKGKEAIAKHLYNNLNKIVKKGHIPGAPGRKDMPQTDADKTKSIDKLKPLAKGKINIAKPFEESKNPQTLKKSKLRQLIREEINKVLNEEIDISSEVMQYIQNNPFNKSNVFSFEISAKKAIENKLGRPLTPQEKTKITKLTQKYRGEYLSQQFIKDEEKEYSIDRKRYQNNLLPLTVSNWNGIPENKYYTKAKTYTHTDKDGKVYTSYIEPMSDTVEYKLRDQWLNTPVDQLTLDRYWHPGRLSRIMGIRK